MVIFDIETNGVARKLRGHTRQVQSLRCVPCNYLPYYSLPISYSWSADDRYLLSASQDWKCVLWDLKDGSRVRTVRFEAPIFIAELHPKNQFVVSLHIPYNSNTRRQSTLCCCHLRRPACPSRHILRDTRQANPSLCAASISSRTRECHRKTSCTGC